MEEPKEKELLSANNSTIEFESTLNWQQSVDNSCVNMTLNDNKDKDTASPLPAETDNRITLDSQDQRKNANPSKQSQEPPSQ